MNWNEYFSIKEDGLHWKRVKTNRQKTTKAGYVSNKDGYIRVMLDSKCYLAHRIIWEMHNGPIPDGMQIDHINHIRHDNRIENLRLVSNQDNQKNTKRSRNNKSGVTGVCWYPAYEKWRAYICIDGKQITLGYFSSIKSAATARKEAELRHDFHKNHGA